MICAEPIMRGPLKGQPATGTMAGYSRHRKAGDLPACSPCQVAMNEYAVNAYALLTEQEKAPFREAAKARARAMREAEPERVRELKRAWASANPESVRLTSTNSRMMKRHRITVDGYEELLAGQGGCCALCGTTEPGERQQRFDIDHDHSCCPGRESCGRCVRGLLCRRCNVLLGWMNDSVDLLIEAAAYLMSSPVRGDS